MMTQVVYRLFNKNTFLVQSNVKINRTGTRESSVKAIVGGVDLTADDTNQLFYENLFAITIGRQNKRDRKKVIYQFVLLVLS